MRCWWGALDVAHSDSAVGGRARILPLMMTARISVGSFLVIFQFSAKCKGIFYQQTNESFIAAVSFFLSRILVERVSVDRRPYGHCR